MVTAVATSSGSERISTMSAVSIATSVPAPIAIPTSAWANAGASLTPSPTIATFLPARCSSPILLDLSAGSTLGHDLLNAHVAGDPFGGGAVVAREHHDLDSLLLQCLDRRPGGRARSVADAEHG